MFVEFIFKMWNKDDLGNILKSLGLVFGDIGTSPIYTLTVIFIFLQKYVIVSFDQILGILSLVFWTMTILVTLQYTRLAMSLSRRGEGGEIVLREILLPLLKSTRLAGFYTMLIFIGISLLVGDSVITPAISLLSAVEGMKLIPGLNNLSVDHILYIAAFIAICLFSVQSKGTEKISKTFGPIMLIWFLWLAISGLISLTSAPNVLLAINPYYALKFIINNGLISFFILSEVILCATGGEALYVDMGHLGRKPIVNAWYFVFVALILNYFGQGAYLFNHPETETVLFEMINSQSHILYIPFLILSIIATVIASQAVISGMFSVMYQAIITRLAPMFKVDYTSEELRSQIYIPVVNWFLLLFVLLIMFVFKESHNLAAAYGLAVTGSMSITGTIMSTIFFIRRKYIMFALAVFVTLIDIIFLSANFLKIPHGGYWSLVIATIPFVMILIYTNGQKKLYQSLKLMKLEEFLVKYNELYSKNKLEGTALFFAKDIKVIPPYITHTMFNNGIIYEDNIIVSIKIKDDPYGISAQFKENPANGLRRFEVQAGYLEVIDLEKIIKDANITEKVIFYGVEDIATENFIWKIFHTIKKLTPSYVQFYKLPSNKLHGIITRTEL